MLARASTSLQYALAPRTKFSTRLSSAILSTELTLRTQNCNYFSAGFIMAVSHCIRCPALFDSHADPKTTVICRPGVNSPTLISRSMRERIVRVLRIIALLKIYPMLLHETLGIRFRYHLDGTITEADIEELAIVVVRSFNNDYTRMITLFEGLYRQVFISS